MCNQLWFGDRAVTCYDNPVSVISIKITTAIHPHSSFTPTSVPAWRCLQKIPPPPVAEYTHVCMHAHTHSLLVCRQQEANRTSTKIRIRSTEYTYTHTRTHMQIHTHTCTAASHSYNAQVLRCSVKACCTLSPSTTTKTNIWWAEITV